MIVDCSQSGKSVARYSFLILCKIQQRNNHHACNDGYAIDEIMKRKNNNRQVNFIFKLSREKEKGNKNMK